MGVFIDGGAEDVVESDAEDVFDGDADDVVDDSVENVFDGDAEDTEDSGAEVVVDDGAEEAVVSMVEAFSSAVVVALAEEAEGVDAPVDTQDDIAAIDEPTTVNVYSKVLVTGCLQSQAAHTDTSNKANSTTPQKEDRGLCMMAIEMEERRRRSQNN